MTSAEPTPPLPPHDHHRPVDERLVPSTADERLMEGTSDLLAAHRDMSQKIAQYGESVVAADMATSEADKKIARRAHREELAKLREEATHDPLTGLLNRRAFMDRLTSAMDSGRNSVLFLVDLDGFKQVNDRLGHPVGDEVLTAAALQLKDTVRRSDTVARLGGDEFAVLLEDFDEPDPEKATRLIEDTQTALADGSKQAMEVLVREKMGLSADELLPFEIGATIAHGQTSEFGEAADIVRRVDNELVHRKAYPHNNQQGFIPMIIMLVLAIVLVIGLAFWRLISSK